MFDIFEENSFKTGCADYPIKIAVSFQIDNPQLASLVVQQSFDRTFLLQSNLYIECAQSSSGLNLLQS